jgi:hypothetical protein
MSDDHKMEQQRVVAELVYAKILNRGHTLSAYDTAVLVSLLQDPSTRANDLVGNALVSHRQV